MPQEISTILTFIDQHTPGETQKRRMQEVLKKINELNRQIEILLDLKKAEERKLEEIMHQIKIQQIYVDYAKKLLNVYKFDPISLQTILTVAQNYGEPTIVLQALNTYGNLKKLEEKYANSKAVIIEECILDAEFITKLARQRDAGVPQKGVVDWVLIC